MTNFQFPPEAFDAFEGAKEAADSLNILWGFLGMPDGSGGFIYNVQGRPGKNYFRVGGTSQFTIYEVTNQGAIADPNLRVRAIKVEGEWVIDRPSPSQSRARYGGNAPAASTAPGVQTPHTTGIVSGDLIQSGRITTSTLGGLFVNLAAFDYPGGYWPGGDFAITPTATPSAKSWVLVGINRLTGLAVQALGTDKPLPYMMQHSDIPAIRAAYPDVEWRWALIAANGDTVVNFVSGVDIRMWGREGVKNNYGASTAPAVTDDITKGYGEGSAWFDDTHALAYWCSDPSVGAAVWNQFGSGVALPDATPTTTGVMLVDQNPSSGNPIALTAPRLGSEHGVAPLGGNVELPSAYLPTPSGAIDEKGRWVKSASNPILIATDTWENTAVCEPCVLFEDGLFKMWYRGGWGTQGIGYATCPQGSDPTDPANWTKSVSNPIIGQGGSGVSGNTAQPSVIHVGSLYYLYYTEFGGSGDMKLATSADGVTAWTIHSGVVMAKISGMTSWGNRYVWREDVTWYMLSEGNDAGGIWHIYLASSTDGLTFTLLNSGNPLTSLVVGSGGGVSGPWMPTPQQIQGLYELWYHAANTGSPLPTNLYRATSPDKINWTIITPNPVLALSGSGFEIDQVADPKPLEVDGISYLFYDGDDNVGSTAAIGVASIACTLHELVNSVGAPIRDDGTGVIPFDELPLATSSTPGIVQPDNTTITISGGVISSVGGGGGAVYAPLVTGDLPGPTPIATVDGQFIMAPTT